MKAFLISIFTLLTVCSSPTYAQESNVQKGNRSLNDRSNEVKIGALHLLEGIRLNLEYERILNRYSSVGVIGQTDLTDENHYDSESRLDFEISPFYRVYFIKGQDYGFHGFFAQVFASYSRGEEDLYEVNPVFASGNFQYYDVVKRTNIYNAFSSGAFVGTKWANNKGFVLQGMIGIGRAIGGGHMRPRVTYPSSVSLGYRF